MKLISNIRKALVLLPLLGIGGLLSSCEKEEIRSVLKSSAVPVVALSSQNIVLTKENADKDAFTISWAKPDYGFNAGASYNVLIDKKGGDFSNATAYATGSELKKTFKTSELNAMLLKMGIKPATAADFDVKVQAILGPTTTLSSVVSSFKATPYLDKLDLSSNWGVVGSATPGGWNGPDVPFYKTDKADVFVAYASLEDGEIKFRQDNKWDVNYGGKGGVAAQNGDNIAVKKGTYRITFDLAGKKYTVDAYSWGLVGDATPNGWNGPDVPFWYDPATDQWRAIATLKKGEIKVRLNNDWGTNFGGANGVLANGGANIAIGTPGVYLVTVNFKENKYTVEAFKAYGIVGSATENGWNGPDAKFRPDFGTEGLWNLSSVKLKDGEIKFRQNDDWGVNYGDDKADGVLELNGANIAVKAGTYDILLDFTNAARPTYKLTKK